MDWLKAISFVALGMMTATRIGLAAVVGVGAAPLQAVASIRINTPRINKALFFIFDLLEESFWHAFYLQTWFNAASGRSFGVFLLNFYRSFFHLHQKERY
jgi:hypothetical protein